MHLYMTYRNPAEGMEGLEYKDLGLTVETCQELWYLYSFDLIAKRGILDEKREHCFSGLESMMICNCLRFLKRNSRVVVPMEAFPGGFSHLVPSRVG